MEDTRRDSVLRLQPSCKNQLFSYADRVIGQALARFALIGEPGHFLLTEKLTKVTLKLWRNVLRIC